MEGPLPMIPPNLTADALNRFIGGRRHYNAVRQQKAIDRRFHLMFHWAKHPHLNRADLARYFGVNRSTITRDIQFLERMQNAARHKHCPLCQGKGRIDSGPATITLIEVISDLKRMDARLPG